MSEEEQKREAERQNLILEYIQIQFGEEGSDKGRLLEIEKELGMSPKQILNAAGPLLE